MHPGIYLAGYDQADVFSGIDPESLSLLHPAWKKDVALFHPWTARQDASGPAQQKTWIAEGYGGDACIWIVETCASTMEVARHLIAGGRLAPWSSVMAVRQTAGRGQRGRNWISPAGNIYATVYWRLDDEQSAPYRHIASLLAGDMLAYVFGLSGIDAFVKWPNDIVRNNRKISGILVEEREGHLLVGIGINLVSAPKAAMLDDDFVLPAACLDPESAFFSPLVFWEKVMTVGRARLEGIIRTMPPEQFVRELENRMAWIGADIRVRHGRAAPFQARLLGLAPDGGLKILRDGHTEVVYTATIRPLNMKHASIPEE